MSLTCTNTELVQIPFQGSAVISLPCENLPDSRGFNLETYDVEIGTKFNQNIYTLTFSFQRVTTPVSVTIQSQPFFPSTSSLINYNDSTLAVQSNGTRMEAYVTNEGEVLNVVFYGQEGTASYQFRLFGGTPGTAYVDVGGVEIQTSPNNVVEIPPIPNSKATIRATVYMTDDTKQISQIDYQIVVVKPSRTVISDYTQYAPDIPSVVCGKGCTLLAKIDTLVPPVIPKLFISYSVLRLILSQELFGCFDVKYLRQKYYDRFLEKLRASIWNAYVPFFETNPFSTYYLYFKC